MSNTNVGVERQKITTEIIKNWNEYIEKRALDIPDDLKIAQKVKTNLWTVFNAYKAKNSSKVEGTVLLDFLNEYVKLHRFQIAIDPEILLKQIHPFHGHLTKVKRLFAFEEIYTMFEYLLVASFEKLQGQFLLSSEICAFALWKYQDNNLKGFMNIEEWTMFLKTFDFYFKNWNDFQSEFEFAVNANKNQFIWNEKNQLSSDNILSFDFFRYIYLERNF